MSGSTAHEAHYLAGGVLRAVGGVVLAAFEAGDGTCILDELNDCCSKCRFRGAFEGR